jgi:ribose 5-phosphate isomerase A
MIIDDHVQGLLEKYVKDNTNISFGTGPLNKVFLKKLARYIEHSNLNIKVIPTSHELADLCAQLKINTASLDDEEVDLAFDFVDQVDEDFNYISNETTSLVRDKMIAQEASEYVVVCEEENFVKQLKYDVCLEVCPFAVNKTLLQVMSLGEPTHKLKENGQPALSETGNQFIDVIIDEVYSVDDIEYMAKRIPGVLETSLFVGYADRVILTGSTLTVKSRLTNPELA